MHLHLLLFIGLIVVVALVAHPFRLRQHRKSNTDAAAISSPPPQKQQIAADLVAELADNRLKCEMFVTVYSEKLHNMRDPNRRTPYENTNDLVHQYPPLGRTAFDRHHGHLHVLGPHIASAVAHIYTNINDNPTYITLESGMTRGMALEVIENIIENAEKIARPIDPVIAGLEVILRDSEKNRRL